MQPDTQREAPAPGCKLELYAYAADRTPFPAYVCLPSGLYKARTAGSPFLLVFALLAVLVWALLFPVLSALLCCGSGLCPFCLREGEILNRNPFIELLGLS